MPAGRPTKYNEGILEKANEYLTNYKDFGDAIPMLCGLAIHLGISRETIYAWSKDPEKQAFSDIAGQIMSSQERALMNGGITGDFNASITKLALAKHGYADSKQITGADGKDLIPTSVAVIYKDA